jgi:predicted oxidoreductase
LHQSGKVRQFGVSNFTPSQWNMLQSACSMRLVANQIELSLNRITPLTDGTLDQCLSEHVTPLAWSPLGGGQLATNDPVDLRMPDHAHRLKIRETLDMIAREREVSRPVVALAWLLKHPAGVIPIIGSTNPDHIADAVHATQLELTREEWYRLMEAARDQRLP